MENSLENDRSMILVVGYVAGVDRLPEHVRELGFVHRVAFVLETSRRNSPDMYFDVELYSYLLDAAREVLGADRICVVDDSKRITEIGDKSEVVRLIERHELVQRAPFPKVLFSRGDRVIGVAESEPWAYCGGPRPYDDSYAVPLFLKEDVSRQIEARVREVCKSLNVELTEVVRANEAPSPAGIVAKLLARIGAG